MSRPKYGRPEEKGTSTLKDTEQVPILLGPVSPGDCCFRVGNLLQNYGDSVPSLLARTGKLAMPA